MGHSNFNAETTWIKGLALRCPMGEEGDPNCPFYKMRLLPFRERMRIIDEMKPSEIADLAACHDACLRRKETERFKLN